MIHGHILSNSWFDPPPPPPPPPEGKRTLASLTERLKKVEDECKQKEEERVTLELEMTEVQESLKKALSGGVTLGLTIEPKSGSSTPQVPPLPPSPPPMTCPVHGQRSPLHATRVILADAFDLDPHSDTLSSREGMLRLRVGRTHLEFNSLAMTTPHTYK